MGNFLGKVRFGLFGSGKTVLFNPQKSLSDNFTAMCALPIFKKRSPATLRLAHVIENCHLNVSAKLTSTERKQNMARIELCLEAIAEWHEAHKKTPSDRKPYVDQFHSQLLDQRKKLLYQDQAEFLAERTKGPSPAGHKYHASMITAWNNPFSNAELRINFLNTFLLPEQKMLFPSLFPNVVVQENKVVSYRRSPHFTAVFLPILNFFMDFDGFDMAFDGVNAALEMSRFF